MRIRGRQGKEEDENRYKRREGKELGVVVEK